MTEKYKYIIWWPSGVYELCESSDALQKLFPSLNKGNREEIKLYPDNDLYGNFIMLTDIGRRYGFFSDNYLAYNQLGIRLHADYPYSIVDGLPIIKGPIILYPKESTQIIN